MNKHFCLAAALALALPAAGCHRYHAMPLSETAVDQALAPPSENALRVAARDLKHPLLKPVILDPTKGLSPDEVAVLAVLLNPSLRSLRDQRDLADAQVLQAGLLPNPQLSYSFDHPSFGLTAATVNGWGWGIDWDVEQLISRSARKESAAANRAAVDLDVAWQEWQAAQAARLALYDLLSLQQQTALAQEKVKRLQDNLDTVRSAVAQHQMTEMDMAAAETTDNQARADLLDLQKQTEQQRLQLNRALGLPPATHVKIAKDVALPDHVDVASLDALTTGVEKRRLDLVALRHGYDSQEATVRAAVLDQFPKINVGFNSARDTGNVGTVGFGVAIDLPFFDRNQGQIAQEEATRHQLFDEYVDRVYQARADIADARTGILFLNRQIATARAAEPGLERLVETYRKGVAAHAADILSYYTAWNDLTAKRIEVLALQRQLVDTHIALDLAAGLYRAEPPARGSAAPNSTKDRKK